MNGGIVAARFPGISMSRPITFRFLQTPNVGVPEPPALRLPPPDPAVKDVQEQLIELGYLLPGDDDGQFGPATQNAILAFQKWERLGRTGLLDPRRRRGSGSQRTPRRSAMAPPASERKFCSIDRLRS